MVSIRDSGKRHAETKRTPMPPDRAGEAMSEKGGRRRPWRKRRVRHPGHPNGPGLLTRAGRWFNRRTRNQRIGMYVGAGIFASIAVAALILLSPIASIVVTPRIASAIEAKLGPGYDVEIGSSRVDVSPQGLDIRLDKFKIRDASGVSLLAVPSAAIGLNGSMMFGGDISLRRLRLTQPHLTLRVEASGEVALAGAEGGPPLFSLPASDVPQGAPAEIFGFIAAADAVMRKSGQLENFELAEILSADITIDDRRRGRIEEVRQVDVRVIRSADSLKASAASAVPRDNWSLNATLTGKPGAERNFDLGFENLSLARILYELMRGKSPADFTGQLFGHVYARLDAKGAVPTAEARIDVVGFSAVEREKPEARMYVERTRLQMAWSGAERRLRIAPFEVFAQNSRFVLAGQARPADEAADRWDFDINGTEQAVPGSDPASHALRFDRIEAQGRIERDARRIVFDRAAVQGRLLSVAGYGTFDFSGERPMGDYALAGSRSPIAAILRVWPGLVAPNALKWVTENVRGGTIDELTIAMRGPLGGKMLHRDLALDAKFSGAVVNYLNGAPPAVGVHGRVHVADERMETIIDGGRVEVEGSVPLSIGGTRFSTADHRPNPFIGELATNIEGPVSAVGALMSAPRLAQMAPGVAPLMRGDGTVSILLTLAGDYGKGADYSRLEPRINASLTGWSMAKALGGRDIDNGNFSLNVEPTAASFRGDVRLSGAPLAVEAVVNRPSPTTFGETVVRFSMDPSKMKGFDTEAVRIAGPISAELVQDAPGVLTNSRLRADLSGATVKGPIGISKAAGAAGQVSFGIQPNGDNWRLANFVATGSGIDIRGALDIAKAGGLASAQFTKFAAVPGDDMRLDIAKSGNTYKVAAQGSAFNAQTFLKDIVSGEPEKRPLDIDLEAKFGTVVGHNGEALTGADFKVSRRNNMTTGFSLSGRLGGGGIEAASAGQEPRTISLRAADAGATLRFIDLYRRMRGGELLLDVVPGDTSLGKLRISGFQIVGDQQLASIASNRPEQRQANGTMTFTRLDSTFRVGGGRILLDDFEVYGNELGATMGGEINYARDRVGISGTFVPAYALNNLFGKLPLLGPILGGGSDGGLVGVTFAIDGPWSSPVMRVNPLSAVAPGFLRKIFEFRNQNPADPSHPQQQYTPPNISGGRPQTR